MMGITGLRLLHLGAKGGETSPNGLVDIQFPRKTVVTSMQMVDRQGRPTYRKDIKV
jgi:hypothetical protein